VLTLRTTRKGGKEEQLSKGSKRKEKLINLTCFIEEKVATTNSSTEGREFKREGFQIVIWGRKVRL